uniref:Uncharacterized protein n=1 Tax=Anopheles epiroticus TaxID=199890 RepID=A0A182P7V9_9DIPT
MEIHVKQCKQRNKRRERAQRMIAERDKDAAADGAGNRDPDDSADDDSGPVSREKPHRPPVRRKRKEKEPSPVLEEDIIDGFAILAFKTYEDIEYAIKLSNKRNEKRMSSILELTTVMVPEEKPPKIIDTTLSKLADKSLNAASVGVPGANKPTSNNNNSINNSESHAATTASTGGSTGGVPGPGGAVGGGAAGAGVASNVNGGDWSPVNSNTHHQLHHLQQQNHHGTVGPPGERTPNGEGLPHHGAGPPGSNSSLTGARTTDMGLIAANGGAPGSVAAGTNHHNHLHNSHGHHNSHGLHNHANHLHPHHNHSSRSHSHQASQPQQHSPQQQQPYASVHHHAHHNHHVRERQCDGQRCRRSDHRYQQHERQQCQQKQQQQQQQRRRQQCRQQYQQ